MNQVRLNQFDNERYNPGNLLYRVSWYMTSLVIFENALPFPSLLKRGLLNIFGAEVGKGVIIKPRVRIKYPHLLHVGDHSWIGECAWIDNLAMVTIGQHCCISQGPICCVEIMIIPRRLLTSSQIPSLCMTAVGPAPSPF